MTQLLDHKGNPASSSLSTDLSELLGTYDLVDVDQDNGTVVLADRRTEEADPPSPIDREIAQFPPSAFLRREYNPKLQGVKGIETYLEMKNDAVVRTSLRIMKTPVLAARWFIEPANTEDKNIEIADFVWEALTQHMSMTWQSFLLETLLMLDYGFMAFEPVYDMRIINGQPRIIWKKFHPLHPVDVHEILYDDQFGGDGSFMGLRYGPQSVEIPPEKLLMFTFDGEANNLAGRSILRSVYKHWYFRENLFKIDAIQKERHGVGVPVIKLPPGFNKESDVRLAREIGENLRSNERSYVIVPPGWEIEFAKLEGQQVDALESANTHGLLIYENVLGSFMSAQQTASGSDMLQQQEQMFQRATRFIADIVRDIMNKFAIPKIVRWNFGVDVYPELKVRRLGDTTDWRTISFAMRNFSGMGALIPDDRLEEWVREELDLPDRDEETAREVNTPQQANVGPPKQSTAAGQGTGSGPAGADASGQGT